jgi:hypothetical protein
MITYISATVISVVFSLFAMQFYNSIPVSESSHPIKIKRGITSQAKLFHLFAFFSAIPLFCVAAFRYGIGTDYFSYINEFERVIRGEWSYFEPGFWLINKLVACVTTNSVWIFIISAFIFSYFTFHAIYEQSVNPAFSILLLVITTHYFIYINQMRQYLAIAIFLYSIKYIQKRRLLHYIILILLAATLHKSILIVIPLYFVQYLRLNWKFVFPLIGGIWALSPFLKSIFQFLVLHTSYGRFYQTEYNNGKGSLFYIIECIIILIFEYWALSISKQQKPLYDFYINCQILAVLFAAFFGFIPLLDRVMNIFTFVQLISLPAFCSLIIRKRDRYFCVGSISIAFIVYMVWQVVILKHNQVLPYQNVFWH